MQGAIFHRTTITSYESQVFKSQAFQSQASRRSPGHGSGVDRLSGKDELQQDKYPALRQVLSILANVVGGALLLSGMLILPHVIAGILS